MIEVDRVYEKVMGSMFSSAFQGAGLRLGHEALSKRYITAEQMGECLRELQRPGEEVSDLGMLLVKKGHLTLDQYLELLEGPAETAEVQAPRIGRYRLQREIARGGMGIVYEAEDPELKRRVALKVIRETPENPDVIQRLHREAAIVARLRHPNIVAVHEVGKARDGAGEAVHFIAMDYISGRTLHEVILDPSVSLQERLRMLEEVARAVGYAHGQGVLHRDLKPANVLVDESGRVVLTDFGLAHAENFRTRLTRSCEVLGTPQYMAPEQVEGKTREIDERTDVYALGVMLYEILVGRPPFRAQTLAKLYHQILLGEPARPSSVRPSLDRDLDVICLKAMARERGHRFAGARELAEDLARVRRGEPILARPPSVWYRWRKRLARRKVVLAGAAAAMLGVGAILVVTIPKLRAAQAKLREEQAEKERQRAQAERYRRLQEEKIKPLLGRIQETRAYFYSHDLPALRKKLAQVEGALTELEELAKDSEIARYPDVWLLQGKGWYLVGDEARAERALLKAAELAPEHGEVNLCLARIDLGRALVTLLGAPEGGRDSAVERAQEYIRTSSGYLSYVKDESLDVREMDRHLVEVYRALARMDPDEVGRLTAEGLERYGDEFGREEYWLLRGSFKSATSMEDLARAIEIRPQYALAYGLRAAKRCMVRQFDDGLSDWSKAIEINPRFFAAYYNRGRVRRDLHDYAGAISDFTEALRVDPASVDAFLARGYAKTLKSDLDGGIEDYTAALRIDPNCAWVYNNRGIAWLDKGDLDAAVSDLTEAIRRAPGVSTMYYNRGNARAFQKDWKGALDDYTEAIRLAPRNATAYHNRAKVREARGDGSGALEDYGEALNLEPGSLSVRQARAELRLRCKDWEGTIEDCNGILGQDSRQVGGYVVRALAELAKGQLDEAIADCVSALSLDPRHAAAYLCRGLAWDMKGNGPAAIADLTRALELAPPDWPDRLQAERALARLREQK